MQKLVPFYEKYIALVDKWDIANQQLWCRRAELTWMYITISITIRKKIRCLFTFEKTISKCKQLHIWHLQHWLLGKIGYIGSMQLLYVPLWEVRLRCSWCNGCPLHWCESWEWRGCIGSLDFSGGETFWTMLLEKLADSSSNFS